LKSQLNIEKKIDLDLEFMKKLLRELPLDNPGGGGG